MKLPHVVWISVAVVLVGSLLPWAEIDLDKVAEQEEGLGAMAAMMLKSFGKDIEVTAWNGHASVGTAKIPVWTVLVAGTLAASLATLRARGMLAVPRVAAPVLAVAAFAVAVTFGVQALEAGRLLAGWWLTSVGILVLAISVLRDPAVPAA